MGWCLLRGLNLFAPKKSPVFSFLHVFGEFTHHKSACGSAKQRNPKKIYFTSTREIPHRELAVAEGEERTGVDIKSNNLDLTGGENQ